MSSSSTNNQHGTAGGSTSAPFAYSNNDLDECILGGVHETCWKLYLDFLKHYRPEEHDELAEAAGEQDVNSAGGNDAASNNSNPSFQHFHKTMKLVQEHNTKSDVVLRKADEHHHRHKLRLNQFADQPHAYSKTEQLEEEMPWQAAVERVWKEAQDDDDDDDDSGDDNLRHRQLQMEDGNTLQVSLLDSLESLMEVASDSEDPIASIANAHHRSLRRKAKFHHKKTLKHRNKQHRNDDFNYQHASDNYNKRATLQLSNAASATLRTRVNMPSDGSTIPTPFSSPQVPLSIRGMEVELHRGEARGVESSKKKNASNKGGSWNIGGLFRPQQSPPKREEEMTWDIPHVGEEEEEESVENTTRNDFSKTLNWASTDNPDGVSLVHSVFDQGTCGSCWAYAATGSVEASAARNAARDYFTTGLQEMVQRHQEYDLDGTAPAEEENPVTALRELMGQTQIVEEETFVQLNLSIQELLDCDTAADQGCVGGNPLLAFFYIHRYGLVPWTEYPYVGYGTTHRPPRPWNTVTSPTASTGTTSATASNQREQDPNASSSSDDASIFDPFHTGSEDHTSDIPDHNTAYTATCQLDKIANPVATVQSWGLLHRNHEDLIELALKYVGPVAVGMNGADPGFVNYGGGIFDSHNCDQGANHALLITGYGQEDVINDFGELETVRYWIARNSWGAGWGENGFVRVKRGPGGKHTPGVCGIARSPSVALGGQLRPDRYQPLMDNAFQMTVMDPTRFQGRNADYSEPSGHDLSGSYHPFCDTFVPVGTSVYEGCLKISGAYNNNPTVFLAMVGIISALVAMIPLTYSAMKRRRRSEELGPHSLSLSGDDDDQIIRRSRSSSSGGSATETTHLLTLKDAYASIRQDEEESREKPRGRSIIIKHHLEQDPFRLSNTMWDANILAAAAAEAESLNRSKELAAAAAAALDSDDEDAPLIM